MCPSPLALPVDHLLQISSFEDVLREIDRRTGVAKCLDVVSRLEYIHDDQVRGHTQ
jgi:hypothetical protein